MQYGLIGEKLGHSFSPVIHGMLASHPYVLVELTSQELCDFFVRRDFIGVNVTIPYKSACMPYLDEIDPLAKEIGAVNTVVNREGRLYGYNTDAQGIRAMLESAQISLKGKKVLILGTGGTSRTATAVAKAEGADILLVSRTSKAGVITYEEASTTHRDAEVIINTTPVGMYPNVDGIPIDLTPFTRLTGVVDVVYNPLTTPLLRAAREKGIPAVGGLRMLVEQAAAASALFTGVEYPQSLIEEVYTKVYNQKKTLWLVGMPSSGKSTLGRLLAEAVGRPFVDLDTAFTETYGEPPDRVIRTLGEETFRQRESALVKAKKYEMAGAVIATGGGAILKEENRAMMREDGCVLFLDRHLDLLTPTNDRPTASTREAMERRYRERYPLYCEVAHHIIPADGTPSEVLAELLEVFKG